MSSNTERENMVHKLMAVTGVDDADFARDLLHGNGWQLEPSVNAHRMMLEDTGSRAEGNNEQMQQQQLMRVLQQQQLMWLQHQQLMWAQVQTHLMIMQQKQHEEQTRSGMPGNWTLDNAMPEWLKEALYGSQPWSLGWTEEQESKYQSELRLGDDWESKADEKKRKATLRLTRQGYVSAELNEDDRKGFSSAHVVMTNRGRALMLICRNKKDGKLKLSCTGGQRKKMREEDDEEDAWTCACREAGEETAGFATKRLRRAAPPAHVAWLGCGPEQNFAGKAVFMYETADRSLAERIQNLGRSPEGEKGLLPLFATPLTAVWVPLQLLRDKKFRKKYLPKWADDERIWMDLANAHLTTSVPASDECEACMYEDDVSVCSSNDTEPSGEPKERELRGKAGKRGRRTKIGTQVSPI